MRISTIQAYNTGVLGIQNNYSNVTRTQEQISSGTRILTPADDPVGSVRLLQLDQQSNKLEQYKANLTAAKNSLTQEEATINSVNNILQRVREITLEAGNGALDKGGRLALAQELAEREEELYGLVNSKNARGEYLFGGYSSSQPPFSKEADGSYTYQGDEGQRSIQIAGSKMIAINDNGKELFADAENINRIVTYAGNGAGEDGGTARISLGEVISKNEFDQEFYPNNRVTIVVNEDASGYDVLDENGDAFVPPISGEIKANSDNSYKLNFLGVSVTLDGELSAGNAFTIGRGVPGNEARTVSNDGNSVAAGISWGVIEDQALFDASFPSDPVTVRIVDDGLGNLGYRFEVAGTLDPAAGEPAHPMEAAPTTSVLYRGLRFDLSGSANDTFTLTAEPRQTPEHGERKNVLDTIASLRQELTVGGDKTEDKLRRRDILSISLQNLDNSMNKVLGVQTTIGARLNVIESTENEHGEAEVINAAVKSGIEDLDYAEALSRLSLQTVVLQAAQQSFVKVSGLSLFNLLR